MGLEVPEDEAASAVDSVSSQPHMGLEVPFVEARSEDEAAPVVDSVSSASGSASADNYWKDAGETWAV